MADSAEQSVVIASAILQQVADVVAAEACSAVVACFEANLVADVDLVVAVAAHLAAVS